MKTKVKESEVKQRILELLEDEDLFLSIRKITLKLREEYGIKKSPQIIKRYLKELLKEEKIETRKNG